MAAQTKKEVLEILNKKAKPNTTWIAQAKSDVENRDRILLSTRIAVRMLLSLKEQKKSQKWLSEQCHVSPQQVNKWLKGNENFTLDTILKLEKALGIKLIEIATQKNPTTVSSKIHKEFMEKSYKSKSGHYTNRTKRSARVIAHPASVFPNKDAKQLIKTAASHV